MPKLTILRGISGSGKSTWAHQQNAIVVSRDNIRHGTLGIPAEDYYKVDSGVLRDREEIVTRLEHASIAALLKAGKDVISDNTNIEWKYVKAIAKIGYRYGADVEVKVFDVSLEEAVTRDRRRGLAGGRLVGFDVIEKQHTRLKANKNMTLEPVQPLRPYSGTPGKMKAFMVDIDGTLAHMGNHRGPFDWDKVGLDDVDEQVAKVVRFIEEGAYQSNDRHNVIVMSGRDESCRDETVSWLHKHDIVFGNLYMRPAGDMRPDNIVKAELFDTYVRDYFDVQFVIDDRLQVVQMWQRMGLKVFNVAGPDGGDF